jgi:cysteine desulfurase
MIYLDHNATTQIAPEVLEAMFPFFTEDWGNPSSTYKFGAKLKAVIDQARGQVADLINAKSSELIFTSCATESNNTAIHAALKSNPNKRHIITSVVEHSSVLNYCKYLEKENYRVTYLPVNHDGLFSFTDLENALDDDTALVSLMWANNETGVLFPVEQVSILCRLRNVLFHCDAVQAIGKLEVDIQKTQPDYLSLSGHKIGAPKGIGALYIRQKTPFVPLIIGGHQEGNLRGGTENVALIVGLGKAASLAKKHILKYDRIVRLLRDSMEDGILNSVPNTELNGHKTRRLPNTSNIRFRNIDNTAILALLDQADICVSSGSACMESAITPSYVITAMTGSRKNADESIRFSLGINNNANEINVVVEKLKTIVSLLS